MTKIIIKGTKSEAFDEKGNPIDCDLSDSNKTDSNPAGFHGVRETSKIAKVEVDRDGVSTTQREWIYQIIKNSKDGLTINEISSITALQKSSVSPRVNELVKANKVYEEGKREVKGKLGIIWKANS